MDSMFFNDYCIVCDRAIVAPKEPDVVVPVKKKVAGGMIRVKNPDGTVTTRTANGTKTTRPPLKRGPNSANRLAAVAAANNTNVPKFQPLTRSKTADPAPPKLSERERDQADSPESATLKTPACPPADKDTSPFVSPIYCSRACAQLEADRSSDLARKMSYDSGLHLVTSGLPISGSGSRKSPYGPPSPLFISGSESSSSNLEADEARRAAEAASSAPNVQSFFHMHRNADEAWRDVNRQRRSSVHPSFRPNTAAAVEMARNRTRSTSSFSAAGPSSDSLQMMWNGEEQFGRSVSGAGRARRTPATEVAQPGWPIASSLHNTTAPVAIPAEFGSAPQHTLNLWHSYHNALARDSINIGTGTSARSSISHPHPHALGSTPTPPPQNPGLPSRRPSHTTSRRPSHTTPAGSTTLQRPMGGTIRAKSKTDVTWDSFGLDEVNASKRRQERISGVEQTGRTPKQTIQVGERGLTIQYSSPPKMGRRESHQPRTQSTVAVSAAETLHPGALAIPQSAHAGSATSPGRTPTNMHPHRSNTDIPDLAALRLGATSCAMSSSANANGTGTGTGSTQGTSGPKPTWNWNKWEQAGGRTYTVPEGLARATKASASQGKAGLFFFK
ncbi:uncharacterized protein MKK02DRAFT_41816 [Dioszegia hungarica]|uniref:Uncharacterized protein n=1 Tax=Dioszegia hungarica TaxID=4972 RepID=A0AA38LXL6_9TREE|nr:uncharacterized protein MKK02DRAFT_41816 [Dioszegia hungarica]KAI9638788.1 hypothetical protein MKK02DRAFT_41816 [Dioszegia hungarica]